MRNSCCETNIWRPRQALADVANVVKPETILGWYRKLVAQKFDGAAQDATLATSLRFSLGEQAKKIPTDKGWDFE